MQGVQHGQLDITTSYNPMQFLLAGSMPTIEIDGQPMQRPWGRQLVDLWPGQHIVRVWFSYMGRSGMATANVGIWAGHATMVRYETPFFVTSSGTLQVLGTRPMGTW